MAVDTKKLLNQTIILFIVGIMILIGQKIGYGIDIIGAIPGILMVIGIAVFAIFMREITPKLQFPAFTWTSLTVLILSMPFMPTSEVFLKFTDQEFKGSNLEIIILIKFPIDKTFRLIYIYKYKRFNYFFNKN